MLAPLAVVVAYEAGYALFRRVGPALAVVCAQVAVTALAPRTAAPTPRSGCRRRRRGSSSCPPRSRSRSPTSSGRRAACSPRPRPAGLVLAVIHPTYAIFLWLPFTGFLVVRSLVRADEARRIATALAALVVPAAAFLVWLLPVVRDTASHGPARASCSGPSGSTRASSTSSRTRATALRPRSSDARARWRSPRSSSCRSPGSPCGGAGRRTSLGGFLAVAAVMLVPRLFVPFSDLVSISQSRRAAGFWPLAFAFAGGLTRARGAPALRPAPGRARGGDRAPARLPGRVRLPARARRAGARDLVRGRRAAWSRSCSGC